MSDDVRHGGRSWRERCPASMRVLVTGSGGFVAPYIAKALRALSEPSLELLGTHRRAMTERAGFDDVRVLDVNDASAVDSVVAWFRPDHFIHLAAVSQIPSVAADVDEAWRTNVLGTLNCARAVLQLASNASFIFASSGQVYDHSRQGHTEDCPIAPVSDYGATKAAADIALGALAERGLRSLRLRLYNHTGPCQAEKFVVPSFAAQIARIEQGRQSPLMQVGDLDAERDFLDVRDVANVYARAVAVAENIPRGTILNVCSGLPVKIRTVLDTLTAMTGMPIAVEADPRRLRKLDLPISYGNPARCQDMLDWKPHYTLRQTLSDVLEYQRRTIA